MKVTLKYCIQIFLMFLKYKEEKKDKYVLREGPCKNPYHVPWSCSVYLPFAMYFQVCDLSDLTCVIWDR